MPSRRTTAVALLSLLLLWAGAETALAHVPKRIVFPVVGKVRYYDDFGEVRGQGRHQGNDIVAPWRALAVAAERGRVTLWTRSWRAGCMLYLHGRSGTTYLYVHLNNDLTRHNDNDGGCRRRVSYAPGLRSGDRVRAGELLGYVGDSGDADGIHPHLHFELHPGGGPAVSPYPWLRRARRVIFAVPGGTDEVRIGVAGAAVSTEEGELAIRARRVWMPNGWRARISRRIVFTVRSDAVVERSVEGERRPAALASLQPDERITVWTPTFAPTLRTQLARPGALEARQILLRG